MTESNIVYMPKDLYVKTLDEVRAKTKTTEKINAKDLPDKIQGIETGVTIGQLNAEEYPEKVVFSGSHIGDVLTSAGNINYFEAPKVTNILKSDNFYGARIEKMYFPRLRAVESNSNFSLKYLKNTIIDEKTFPALEYVGEHDFFRETPNVVEINLPKLKDISSSMENIPKIKKIFLPNLSQFSNAIDMPELEELFIPKINVLNVPPNNCPKIKDMYFSNDNLKLNRESIQQITGEIDSKTSELINNNYHLSTYILNTNKVATLKDTNTYPYKFSKIVKFYVKDELLDQYKSATNWSLLPPEMIQPISELPAELKEKYKEYL